MMGSKHFLGDVSFFQYLHGKHRPVVNIWGTILSW